jgi:phosphoribosylformylglycinamidine synthase subunit PurL
VRPGAEASFASLCAAHEVPSQDIGTTGGDSLTVTDCFSVPLDELGAGHARTLPALFG